MKEIEKYPESNQFRKVDSTDMTAWVWPYSTVYLKEKDRNKRPTNRTVISTESPPHCKLFMRVYVVLEKGARCVDLVQMLEVQTIDGFLYEVPSWVDDIILAEFIDDELKCRYPTDKINKTSVSVIDKEVRKLRAIQSNYTFVASSRIQPELARTLVGTGPSGNPSTQ